MERAVSRPAKFRAAVIFSVIAVMVILGIAWIVNTRPPVTPPPGASGAPVSNPSVSGRATFQKVPNQVLFALDDSGNPDVSGDLTNIKQGDAGDCYFLAALMTVASRAPATVVNMVHDNGNGTYTVLDRTSPKLAIMPIVEGVGTSPVHIIGFGMFYLEGTVQQGGDVTVSGRFINTVIPGQWGPLTSNYGLRVVKLVE